MCLIVSGKPSAKIRGRLAWSLLAYSVSRNSETWAGCMRWVSGRFAVERWTMEMNLSTMFPALWLKPIRGSISTYVVSGAALGRASGYAIVHDTDQPVHIRMQQAVITSTGPVSPAMSAASV